MMRTGINSMLLGAALLTGLLSLGGCKQAEGERCQVDQDCDTGLYCELSGNTRAVGGYCRSTTSTPVPQVDLATPTKPADMTTTPPPPDMTMVTD